MCSMSTYRFILLAFIGVIVLGAPSSYGQSAGFFYDVAPESGLISGETYALANQNFQFFDHTDTRIPFTAYGPNYIHVYVDDQLTDFDADGDPCGFKLEATIRSRYSFVIAAGHQAIALRASHCFDPESKSTNNIEHESLTTIERLSRNQYL